jgi:hypothetical protein
MLPPPTGKDTARDDMLNAIAESKSKHRAQSRHDVRKIDDDLNTYYNSVNVLTGAQGAGKTFAALTEILAICRATENTHLLVFVKRKAYDPTFENIRELIAATGCRIDEVEYEEAEEYIHRLFAFKALYNSIRRARENGNGEWDVPKEFGQLTTDQLEELGGVMFDVLNVHDFKLPWLNTLILFDDVGNSSLFKNPDSYMNNRLKLCRDDHACYFLCIHGIGQLSPSIRSNTAIVYIQGTQ